MKCFVHLRETKFAVSDLHYLATQELDGTQWLQYDQVTQVLMS
jgi:hypothetical protein